MVDVWGDVLRPGVPGLGPRQTVQAQIRRRVFDQGLHCLLTGISFQNRIKIKKYTSHP